MSDAQLTGCFTQLPGLPTAAHCCPCRHIASGLASPLCLQASLSGLLALTAGCNQQYLQWQVYPASGAAAYVNHTATGLCLYPGSRLTLRISRPEAPHSQVPSNVRRQAPLLKMACGQGQAVQHV